MSCRNTHISVVFAEGLLIVCANAQIDILARIFARCLDCLFDLAHVHAQSQPTSHQPCAIGILQTENIGLIATCLVVLRTDSQARTHLSYHEWHIDRDIDRLRSNIHAHPLLSPPSRDMKRRVSARRCRIVQRRHCPIHAHKSAVGLRLYGRRTQQHQGKHQAQDTSICKKKTTLHIIETWFSVIYCIEVTFFF